MAQSTQTITNKKTKINVDKKKTLHSKHWFNVYSCTFTLQALFDDAPQQTSTVVTEGGTHVVVDLKTVRHVNLKTFLLELREQRVVVVIFVHEGEITAHVWSVLPHSSSVPHLFNHHRFPSCVSTDQSDQAAGHKVSGFPSRPVPTLYLNGSFWWGGGVGGGGVSA